MNAKDRYGARARGLPMTPVLLAVGAAVALGVGLWIGATRGGGRGAGGANDGPPAGAPAGDRAAQVRETFEVVSLVNRAKVVGAERAYWAARLVPDAELAALASEDRELMAAADKLDAELDRKYGAGRKGVKSLDPKLGAAVEAYLRRSAEGTRDALEASGLGLDTDLLAAPGKRRELTAKWVAHARAVNRQLVADLELEVRELLPR